jgi:hypothetical protein
MSIIHAAFGWKIKRHEEWREEKVKTDLRSLMSAGE